MNRFFNKRPWSFSESRAWKEGKQIEKKSESVSGLTTMSRVIMTFCSTHCTSLILLESWKHSFSFCTSNVLFFSCLLFSFTMHLLTKCEVCRSFATTRTDLSCWLSNIGFCVIVSRKQGRQENGYLISLAIIVSAIKNKDAKILLRQPYECGGVEVCPSLKSIINILDVLWAERESSSVSRIYIKISTKKIHL